MWTQKYISRVFCPIMKLRFRTSAVLGYIPVNHFSIFQICGNTKISPSGRDEIADTEKYIFELK